MGISIFEKPVSKTNSHLCLFTVKTILLPQFKPTLLKNKTIETITEFVMVLLVIMGIVLVLLKTVMSPWVSKGHLLPLIGGLINANASENNEHSQMYAFHQRGKCLNLLFNLLNGPFRI